MVKICQECSLSYKTYDKRRKFCSKECKRVANLEDGVVFRKFKDGQVIAIFPYLLGNRNPNTCLSYMKGQHSVCDEFEIVKATQIATFNEYVGLLNELLGFGYNCRLLKRVPNKSFNYRKPKLGKQYERFY